MGLWYSDRPEKLTNAAFCFHLEARIRGVRAVQRLGIDSPRDLLSFQHYTAFWRDAECLKDIDHGCLGLIDNNRHLPKQEQRRRPTDEDRRHGLRLAGVLVATPTRASICGRCNSSSATVTTVAAAS